MDLHRRALPLVVGHRGAPAEVPANTLAGLAAAVAAAADLVEFDLGPGLLLGHPGERQQRPAPSLAEALALLAPHPIGIQIDLKVRGVEREVADAVRAAGLSARVAVSTTWGRSLALLAQCAPELTRVIGYPRDRLGAGGLDWPEPARVAGSALVRIVMPLRARVLLHQGEPAALALHHRLVSAAVVATVHAAGAALFVWTVNDPGGVVRMTALGADAIVSDDPGMVRGVLATLNSL